MYSLFINNVLISSSEDFNTLVQKRYSKILDLLQDSYKYIHDNDAKQNNYNTIIELIKDNDVKRLSIVYYNNTTDNTSIDIDKNSIDKNSIDTNNIDTNSNNDNNFSSSKKNFNNTSSVAAMTMTMDFGKNFNKSAKNRGDKNYKNKFTKKVPKKKYSLRDQRDDLERLELLLIGLEAPSDYKKVYTKIYINNEPEINTKIDIATNIDTNIDTNISIITDTEKKSSLSLDYINLNEEEELVNYYYDIDKGNLIWLNHNLSLLNKRNIKLIETLKLIQRILKKI